jgi:hypothetical protein
MRPLLPASEIQSIGSHFSDEQPSTSQFARQEAVGNRGVALIISESEG